MKKITSIILALVLIIGCLTILSSCQSSPRPECPDGYQFLPMSYISFAYPDDWYVTSSNGVPMVINPSGTGNNITYVSEVKTKLYEEKSAEEFIELLKPQLDSIGMTTANPEKEVKEVNGLEVIIFSYDAELEGTSFKQICYIVSEGSYTHTVSVTLLEDDPALLENVFNTLHTRSMTDVFADMFG